jgi:hypothetical protein
MPHNFDRTNIRSNIRDPFLPSVCLLFKEHVGGSWQSIVGTLMLSLLATFLEV